MIARGRTVCGACAAAATAALAALPAVLAPTAPALAAAASAASAVDPATLEDIRDIRGAKFVLSLGLVLAVVVGVVVLGLAAAYLWRHLHRTPAPRVLTPWEMALERLAAIRAVMQPETAREFSIDVSDVVRSYIEQRFAVTATHRTTEEFLRDLLGSANAALAQHRTPLAEFLSQCDLVKFAGESLTAQSMESLHHSAREFVLATKEAHDPLPAA